MTVRFREAARADVPEIIALLEDDVLGSGREGEAMEIYLAAFDAVGAEGGNTILVGEDGDGRIVATCQLTFISGLSLRAAKRAQVESVRVASDLRGQGIGHLLLAEAERRARAAGCALMQFTSNRTRADAGRFYERLGFEATHVGFKKTLT